jgi:hypothetical protein
MRLSLGRKRGSNRPPRFGKTCVSRRNLRNSNENGGDNLRGLMSEFPPLPAARAIAQARLVNLVSTVAETPLETNRAGAIVFLLGFCWRCGKMITAAEYRAWAEESLEWARNATNQSSRDTCIKFAEIWLESALRVERLAALERLSKEPIPTAEHVWQLPPYQDWPHKRTPLK